MSVFHTLFEDFPGTFLLDPDPDRYRFFLDPDPYQSSSWIGIRNEFFHILDLDPDLYQNDTDPPHWFVQSGRIRASTQADVEQFKICICRKSCSAQSCLDSFIAVRAL